MPSPVDVLYAVHSDGSISTYDVDPTSGKSAAVGSAVAILPQDALNPNVVPSPDDHVIYVFWGRSSDANAHVSVFATDASGVPQLPALQKLDVPPKGAELLVDPKGRFVYALEVTTPDNQAEFDSQLVLFQVAADGQLQNPQVLQTFHDAYHDMGLYRISAGGTALYLTSTVDFDGEESEQFERYSIDSTSGNLGPQTDWFEVDGFAGEPYYEGIVGDKYMLKLNRYDYNLQDAFIEVYANSPSPGTPLIHCTATMLSVCQTGKYLRLDPSEQFLFLDDPQPGSNDLQGTLHILRIDAAAQRLDDTGAAVSYSGGTVIPLFSPDGQLVYLVDSYSSSAASKSLTVYKFDATTGAMHQGTVLQLGANDIPFSALRK